MSTKHRIIQRFVETPWLRLWIAIGLAALQIGGILLTEYGTQLVGINLNNAKNGPDYSGVDAWVLAVLASIVGSYAIFAIAIVMSIPGRVNTSAGYAEVYARRPFARYGATALGTMVLLFTTVQLFLWSLVEFHVFE